ncbi:FAD/NAD(P)-binding protein [Changchengzhania lutea]|uniref:FAD/NAD(P)-binding protein n=1 Tax=Changchengzhania lutea TaxID=2049305 RepID=UPI00115EE94C|nr:FAD/NAD(P)-binding protein [Changchengzhania lutea]
MKDTRTLAIVGAGPRGHYALECFLLELSKQSMSVPMNILMFEETPHLGYGPVYNLDQPDTNWVNISERILFLEPRQEMILDDITIPAFPSYHDWYHINPNEISEGIPDNFPPRSKIGTYLKTRFQSMLQVLLQSRLLTVIQESLEDIDIKSGKLYLSTNTDHTYQVDEVLLTIGHQPSKLSKQIKAWQQHAQKSNNIVYSSPYPIQQFFENDTINNESVIGIRGFGLAMIDVVRGISEELGGTFKVINKSTAAVEYQASTKTPKCFVPFSLDGLPMSPKPINASIDAWFKPTTKQLDTFSKCIKDKETQKSANSNAFLIQAVSPIIADIYINLELSMKMTQNELKSIVEHWLQDASFEHTSIVSKNKTPLSTMKNYVEMATGNAPSSLDFCIGQLWRHCQPIMYDALSYNACKDDVIADIIDLDERLKRYSYGPPVESLQQLLALIEAKAMTLDVVDDPKISSVSNGWELRKDNKSITVSIMVNSVLDPPKLVAVDTPIITNMLQHKLIQPIHDDLGILTDDNAYVISDKTQDPLPIAVLGRLAKGTIIGVDAILECFGDRPKQWAKAALTRHLECVSENE